MRVYVSTPARNFVVRAFRMGWYRGAEGRLIWTSPSVRGGRQSGAMLLQASTHTMSARWRSSLVIATTGWPLGDYLLRLDASTGGRSFVPLTVRPASTAGSVVLVNAVTTWQAYNTWGCCSLYSGEDGAFVSRSRAVTFDRPYVHENGAGEFIERELPVVAEAERLGLPLAYVTDVDLEANPHLLRGARAVVSMGHDEYWSPAMRAAVTVARDAGTNLAFLGANAVFRKIRFGSTSLGPDRLEINYKLGSEDPIRSKNESLVTGNWPDGPHAMPESALIGAQYACFPGARVSGVVVDPESWLFAGTAVKSGTTLPGLIGPETDAVQLGFPTPRPIEVLLHSPTRCPGGGPSHADTTYYVAPSGAGVFDAGTIDWACDVGGGCHASGSTGAIVRRITDNLLRAFAVGPAGRTHQAHDNLKALGIASR